MWKVVFEDEYVKMVFNHQIKKLIVKVKDTPRKEQIEKCLRFGKVFYN